MALRTSLPILDDPGGPVVPLRGRGRLTARVDWPPAPESELPRTLRGLARIVGGGLCHRCGTCVGICPTGVLATDGEDYPYVADLGACTDCELCVRVCPGDEFDLGEAHRRAYGTAPDPESTHGTFEEAIVAHATSPDVREGSTSGGLVTALMLDLLDRGRIDGVVSVTSDESVLWKGRPVVARTREEILAGMKSKYAITATNSVLDQIRTVPGRYAVVGLPCQIHGIVKARALDKVIDERVVLTVGLFCHAAIEHEAYDVMWDTLGTETEGASAFVSRVGKHPGTPHVVKRDGRSVPFYYGSRNGYRPTSIEMINILYRLYTPDRCLTCFDATSEFADIAVGDPWMAPPEDGIDFAHGWSFALIRSRRGADAVAAAAGAGRLVTVPVSRRDALRCNSLMAGEKRWRAFRVIETHRRQGRPTPEYRTPTPAASLSHFVKTEAHMLSHVCCYLPSVRAAVLRFMLGGGGYNLLRLNSWRRRFRFWRRDTAAAVRRRLRAAAGPRRP